MEGPFLPSGFHFWSELQGLKYSVELFLLCGCRPDGRFEFHFCFLEFNIGVYNFVKPLLI